MLCGAVEQGPGNGAFAFCELSCGHVGGDAVAGVVRAGDAAVADDAGGAVAAVPYGVAEAARRQPDAEEVADCRPRH